MAMLTHGAAPTGDIQMPDEKPTVCIIDGDPDFRESISLMVHSMGLDAAAYSSAEAFLDGYSSPSNRPKCMVVAARMSGLSGLGLQQILAGNGKGMPIIMVSGCADISMAVQAMRAGALDFLEKPINSQVLSIRIREAIDYDVCQHREAGRKTELVRHVERLSSRQREVFNLLVSGENSKQIARELDIGEKTVAKHRATVLEKMQVDSVVELARLYADAHPAHGMGMEHVMVTQCN
jgi:two-component system, LuxR family, response regulator FixJ